MCLAQGLQRSDAGEARTRGPSVSSQALYHWATAPKYSCLAGPMYNKLLAQPVNFHLTIVFCMSYQYFDQALSLPAETFVVGS